MPIQQKRKNERLVIANESFVTQENGVDQAFHQGRTRRYENDEVVKRLPHYFDYIEDHDQAAA